MSEEGQTLLVDASVFITLAAVDAVDVLTAIDDDVVLPKPVSNEISDEPASGRLSEAVEAGRITTWDVASSPVKLAADHLGEEVSDQELQGRGHARISGDIGLLALALSRNDSDFPFDAPVVVTDDKPLRKTCKALSIPVSGSIGVLVRAVERDDLEADVAEDKLYAMDEVGARLSASLIKRAESLIEEASDK